MQDSNTDDAKVRAFLADSLLLWHVDSNFQLYVAALFSVWFLYELFSRQPQNVP